MPVFAEKSQENRRFFKISTQKQARKEPARFVRRIVRYCLNNHAICEGINSMIQTAKRKARGYRTFDGYATMIYIVAGKLDIADPFALPV